MQFPANCDKIKRIKGLIGLFSRKDLLRLIIPLVIEQILAVTIGMADTMMVSSVGEAAVSGISLVDTINILLIQVFSALATGGAVVSSQYLGRGDQNNACKAAKQLVYAITACALLLMTIALVFRKPIIRLAFGSIQPDVMQNANTYLLLSALSYPFLAIYNAGAALYRSMNNSKISMFVSLLMNFINISGNAILIFVFRMGVAGAGLASLASRAAAAIIMLLLLRKSANPIHVRQIHKPEFHPQMVKNILHIGIPNGLENGMFQIGKVMVQSLIASFGTISIAANAVANNFASVEVLPGSAIGLAMITVVGQCVGAHDYAQAKAYAAKLMKITYLAVGVLNIVVLLLVNPLVGCYSLSAETAALAKQLLIYHSICCMIIWPASFTLPNTLRAANDVKFTMLLSIVSMWTCRIALSYILGGWFGLGVLGVWIAMTADWLVRAVGFTARFISGRWKHRQLIS